MAVLGIDIGGSGIKGAPVDTRRGKLVAERFRIETPQPAKPDAVVDTVGEIAKHFAWSGPVGVTFPGVVMNGRVCTAANVDKSWIGQDLPVLLRERCDLDAVALNDADAAGVAEVAHGCAKGARGVVLLLTFGTGIGSALLYDGKLVPNSELGHLQLRGKDAERRAAESVREQKKWSWRKWATNANDYLEMVENLLWPELILIGGGIAKKPDSWLSLLKTRAELRVAALGNEAGIVGAAMTAARGRTSRA